MYQSKAMRQIYTGPAKGHGSVDETRRFKSIIVGSGTLPLQCAEILLGRGHDICGIISNDAPFVRWAEERAIPHVSAKQNIVKFLSEYQFDYLFSIVNEHILPKEVFDLPLKCSINYHDSPLPRYAGTHATSWALLNRELFHGITWHVIAEMVDAGDILKQPGIAIAADDTAFTLNVKCYEAAINSFAELVDELSAGRAVARKQNLGERTFFPKHKRPAAGSVISWSSDANDISALIRALDFGHYPNPLGLAKFPVGGEFIVVSEADVVGTKSKSAPGTVTGMDSSGVKVSTATSDVMLRKLRTIDGEALSIGQFIAKFGICVGYRFEDLDQATADQVTAWNGLVAREESFWVKRLAALEPVSLPYFVPSQSHPTETARYFSEMVPIPDSIFRLPFNRNNSCRRSDLVIAAFAAYLASLAGSEKFDIGFRDDASRLEMTGLEGLFASSVPLRFESGLTQSFGAVLSAVQKELALLERRKTFARDIVMRYPSLRSMMEQVGRRSWPVSVELVASSASSCGRADSMLTMFISGDCQECRWVYDDRVLSKEDAKRMLAQFETFLRGIAENPDRPFASLPLLGEKERDQLLVEWNNTILPYLEQGSIQGSFEEIASQNPDDPALTCRNETWTFGQLNGRANMIAQYLRAAGAGPESIVGVCLERSLDLVAGMLGILKTGAAYLPLDPAYPPERLAVMIGDAQPLLVLSNEKSRQNLAAANARILSLDRMEEIQPSECHLRRNGNGGGDQLAYVIYTSGSTGKPKGVMIEQRNVMNFFTGMDNIIGRQPGVWLAVASVSFDISVLEIWWPLTRGFQVVLWPGVEGGKDLTIPELIRLHKVTHMQSVPSFLRTVMKLPGAIEALATLRVQVVGGEEVPPSLIRDLGSSPTRRIIDMYGPTETTVVSTAWEIEPGAASVSIGRPIANTKTFVLTPHGWPTPLGVVGELFIGGAGVSRGYLNRPELNREKFVQKRIVGLGPCRLYRTGDLARYLPDGRLEYIGRVDNQVKVRGHRLELSGIETVLSEHPAVQAAVIDVQPAANGEQRLVGYVVPQTGQKPSPKELREWIGRRLPSYMVPVALVTLEALPKNENGKLDRKALPPPEAVLDRTPSKNRPLTPLEAGLVEVWCEILNNESVGLEDDFFQLGGNSLMAVNLTLAIEQRLGIKLPLELLLEAPTVARLAEKLKGLNGSLRPAAPEVPAVGTERHVPPRTATERRLVAIWERLLKVRPIGIRDSFIELQEQSAILEAKQIETKRESGVMAEGSSLGAFLEAMQIETRGEFGVMAEDFSLNAFLEEPTIEALARNIDRNNNRNNKPAASLAICLQPRGSNPPLFLVHDGGSSVFVYRALAAHLGTDRPVYGIRAEAKPDGFPFYRGCSVEEVAARYIAEIKTLQPRGPYSLGGACSGGIIAFEMARQLRSHGDKVFGPVLLFDSFMHNNPRIRREEEVAILQRVGVLAADTYWTALRRRIKNQLTGASQLGLMKAAWIISGNILRNAPSKTAVVIRKATRKLRAFPARLAGKFGRKDAAIPGTQDAVELMIRRLVDEFWPASGRLQAKYVPTVYQGSLVLFKAREFADPEPLWTGLAQGGMVVHEMSGSHLGMLNEPAVTTTAALVNEHFSRYEIQENEAPCVQHEEYDEAAGTRHTRLSGRIPFNISRPLNWITASLAGGMATIALIVFWAMADSGVVLATLQNNADVVITSADGESVTNPSPGFVLKAGDQIRSMDDEGVELKFEDVPAETTLHQEAEARIGEVGESPVLFVMKGVVDVSAQDKAPDSEPNFILRTPQAKITAGFSNYTLNVTSNATTIISKRGEVGIERLNSSNAVRVPEGHYALVKATNHIFVGQTLQGM